MASMLGNNMVLLLSLSHRRRAAGCRERNDSRPSMLIARLAQHGTRKSHRPIQALA